MPVARRLLLGEHQRRLHLFYLCLIGADLCLLPTELRVDGLDVGLRSGHLRLLERDAVIAIVDTCDHAAGGDVTRQFNSETSTVAKQLFAGPIEYRH